MKSPPEKHTSQEIESFLNYIRDAEQTYNIANADEDEANKQVQDSLHEIEIDLTAYHKLASNAKNLKSILKERRIAKNTAYRLQPVKEWAEANRHVIKTIEQLLGTVRKIEKKLETRVYTYKSDKALIENGGSRPLLITTAADTKNTKK